MAKYITHLEVSLNEAEEQKLQSKDYRKINVNLNEGAGGNTIYFWYKTDPTATPITRIQFTFNETMSGGLINAGFKKINKNLNAGAGGDHLYLWYLRGNTEYDIPIVDLDVTINSVSEAQKFKLGYEKLPCNLNRRTKGNWIHLWVKRVSQTYICDVIATDSFGEDKVNFNDGYIRLDEDTNRDAGGASVFIWYRLTTNPQRALTDLQISTNNDEYQALQQQDYKIVNVNLNEGTGSKRVYLWYKQDKDDNPIKTITLLLDPHAVPAFQKAGVQVIEKNLNVGTRGSIEYLCVYQ